MTAAKARRFQDAAWGMPVLDRRMADRGMVITVASPTEMDRDNPEIVGAVLQLDGSSYRVKAVERTMPRRPIAEGESIGLLLEEVEPW